MWLDERCRLAGWSTWRLRVRERAVNCEILRPNLRPDRLVERRLARFDDGRERRRGMR